MTRHHKLSICILAILQSSNGQTLVTRFEISEKTKATSISSAASDSFGNFYVSSSESAPLARTSDGGRTWLSVPPGDWSGSPALVVDPEDPETLYACSDTLQRTTNGGELWYSVHPARCVSFAVDSGNRSVLMLATGSSTLRSVDFGNHWVEVPLEPSITRVVADRSGFGQFASVSSAGSLFLSADRGAAWQKQTALTEAIRSVSFSVYKPGAVYAASVRGFYFRDPNGVWFLRESLWAGTLPNSRTIYTIYADPRMPERVWAATSAGLRRSDDEGVSWTLSLTGDYQSVAGCGRMFVTAFSTTWYSDDGFGWNEYKPRPDSLSFGAGCAGYGMFRSAIASSTRKWNADGRLVWERPVAGMIRLLPDGRIAIGSNSIEILEADGSVQNRLRTPFIADRFEVGDDGQTLAASGYVPTLSYGVAVYDRDGTLRASFPGHLLAIRPQDGAIAFQPIGGFFDLGVGRSPKVRLPDGNEETLDHIKDVLSIRYFANGDYVAAGWVSAQAIWIGRYTSGSAEPVWRGEYSLRERGSLPRVWISADTAERVLVEVRHDTTSGSRTFLQFDRNGDLQWDNLWRQRQFVMVKPDGSAFVTSTEGGGARIESVVP